MKLKYETAIATLIQFITLSLLGLANGIDSIVTTCHSSRQDCVSNTLVSLIFFILTAAWFAAVWVIGYMAQERRSRKLAQLLIATELVIGLIALFNAKHHSDILSLFTSVVDFGLAAWIIVLAIRLIRAKGGRVVSRNRRRRPPHSSDI
jgi:hypothetical protein